MIERLNYFLDSIGLEKKIISDIINGISRDIVDDQLVVKAAIDFILTNNKDTTYEVEKKILNIDLDVLIIKLEKLGAIKTFKGYVEDKRYDFDTHLFKNEGMICRIRQTDVGNYITLKKQVHDLACDKSVCSKDCEFELRVDDINKVINSINDLGLISIEGKHYKKYRISYKLDGVHFDFDKYEGIPWLLEIESDNERTIDFWKMKLGLDSFESVKYGRKELVRHYNI